MISSPRDQYHNVKLPGGIEDEIKTMESLMTRWGSRYQLFGDIICLITFPPNIIQCLFCYFSQRALRFSVFDSKNGMLKLIR